MKKKWWRHPWLRYIPWVFFGSLACGGLLYLVLPEKIEASGVVVPTEWMEIQAPIPGFLVENFPPEGTLAAAGTPVFSLNPQERIQDLQLNQLRNQGQWIQLQTQVRELELQARLLDQRLDRLVTRVQEQRILMDRGLGAKDQLRTWEEEYQTVLAQRIQAVQGMDHRRQALAPLAEENQLLGQIQQGIWEKSVWTAPFTGLIFLSMPGPNPSWSPTPRLMKGARVQGGQVMGYLAGTQGVCARLQVPEAQGHRLVLGQKVKLFFTAFPFSQFSSLEGEIQRIWPGSPGGFFWVEAAFTLPESWQAWQVFGTAVRGDIRINKQDFLQKLWRNP